MHEQQREGLNGHGGCWTPRPLRAVLVTAKGLCVCVCVFFPTRLFASAPRSVPAFQRVACDVGSIHGIFKALKPKWENQMEKEEDPELSSCVFGVHGIQSDSRLSLKRAEQSRV